MNMDIALIVIWSIFIVVTIIVELETADLITIWFTVGAAGALVAAALGASPLIQLGIFIVVSLVLLLLTRPLTKNMMKKEIVRTNADRLIGMTAVVTKAIGDGEVGEVRIEHAFWRAVNFNGQSFSVNEKVRIDAITGSRLVVSKLEDSDSIIL